MDEGNDDDYDQWSDNQVAEELKGMPVGMYHKDKNGKLVPVDNRSNEEVMFDEIVADINEKLEEANYYYKKTAKILKDLTKEL